MSIHDLKKILPGSSFYIVGRVKNRTGDWAAAGDFSAINLRVVNEKTNVNQVEHLDLDGVIVPLTVDKRWKKDTVGYNFAYLVDGADIPASDTNYLFKFELVGLDDKPSYAYARVRTLVPVYALPADSP